MIRISRAAWISGLFLVAAPTAQALAPPLPSCAPEAEAERVLYTGGYSYWWGGAEGFVEYQPLAADQQTLLNVLEFCPTGEQLVVSFGVTHDDSVAVRDLYRQMMSSEQEYTLARMDQILRDAGHDSRLVRANYQSCACAGMAGN